MPKQFTMDRKEFEQFLKDEGAELIYDPSDPSHKVFCECRSFKDGDREWTETNPDCMVHGDFA